MEYTSLVGNGTETDKEFSSHNRPADQDSISPDHLSAPDIFPANQLAKLLVRIHPMISIRIFITA